MDFLGDLGLSGSGEEGGWSITDWQCGLGVTEECKGVSLDWDTPDTWRVMVNELVPVSETLIVFGIQYLSSTLGEGTMRAVNSIRCMFNNAATNSW